MTSEVVSIAASAKDLGLVGILILLLGLAGWVIRFLYKEKHKADTAQQSATVAVVELKGDVRVLEAKQVAREAEQERAHEEHLTQMNSLHRGVLEVVERNVSRPAS